MKPEEIEKLILQLRTVIEMGGLESPTLNSVCIKLVNDFVSQAQADATEAERKRIMEEVDEVLESLIGIAKTYAMQTIDRHGVTRRAIEKAEALRAEFRRREEESHEK